MHSPVAVDSEPEDEAVAVEEVLASGLDHGLAHLEVAQAYRALLSGLLRCDDHHRNALDLGTEWRSYIMHEPVYGLLAERPGNAILLILQ